MIEGRASELRDVCRQMAAAAGIAARALEEQARAWERMFAQLAPVFERLRIDHFQVVTMDDGVTRLVRR